MHADPLVAFEGTDAPGATIERGSRIAHEHAFVTHDGTELFYRHWPAVASAGARRAVLLFHRGHEHSGRVQHIVDELDLAGCDMFAWDARGHGSSPGERGDSPGFAASIKDVDTFVRHIEKRHGIAVGDIAVIAQSMAAVLVAAWVHDFAPRVRSIVLTAPAFGVKLYVPFARAGLALLYRLRGNFFITSYVKPRFLTHDPDRIRSYDEDTRITRAISVRVLLGLLDTADRILVDAQAIRVPTLMLVSDTDWVVQRAPQDRFFEQLGSAVKEKQVLRGFLHDTLGELERAPAIRHVRDFVLRHFTAPAMPASLLDADRHGHTYQEILALRAPLPALSLRNLDFALTRLAMRTLGRLSAGIRIGLASGFDSGRMLDYVYSNRAQGHWLIGRLIDRGFLDAIGWRGIRVRKRHMALALAEAARRLQAAGIPIDVMDVAAGPGTYVLDAIRTSAVRPRSILLRDYDPDNIVHARAAISRSEVRDIARAEQADAFDEASIASVQPHPSLVIVCGLYELYPDNAPLANSLAAIAASMTSGGYLVYTGQPWHPQLELIARTLVNHRDRGPWIMRRRSQAELDELVARAGFEKLEQWIDEWGMFTVSIAVREGSSR